MNFNEYQELSQQTAQGYADPNPDSEEEHKFHALFLALALNGEGGELGEKIKKYVREDDPEYLMEAYWELGDVLWYLTQLASLLNAEMNDVAEDNIDKLLDRDERDMITGQGDNR
jgi:NTP pyrophosphatase (non-canonical NTP hydrolase)